MSLRRIRNAVVLAAGLAALAAPAALASSGGSATLTLTQPVAKTITHSVALDCALDGSTYHATVMSSTANVKVALTDVVLGYNGAGTYESTARLTVEYLPRDVFVTRTRQVKINVDATAATGSLPFSVTFDGRRHTTVAGTVSWQCAS